jgi:hypothetical protein
MSRHHSLKTLIMCSAVLAAAASGACGRDEQPTPVTEVQSQASQPTNRPMTATGCLIAGEAANTFVLTAAQTEGSPETATYQLVAGPQADLRSQVGQRVKVSGTMELREAAVAQTVATPAPKEGEPATGTAGAAGKPTVQTRTDVAINRLTVDSMTPLGEKCGM